MRVTIDGANFGTSGTVTFAGQVLPAAAVTSWSQTAIVVTEPAGEGANVPVGVTVAGQTSNVLDFSYAPPSITAISPATGPTAGGVPVTIDGANFGTSGTVTFAGQVAVLTSWSQTAIVVTEPAGEGSQRARRRHGRRTDVQRLGFLVRSAVDHGDLAGHGADGGWRAGHDRRRRNFGRSGTVMFAGQVAVLTSWSQTAIVVTEPAGEGANVPVVVTVAGQTSNVLDFSYAPAVDHGDLAGHGADGGWRAGHDRRRRTSVQVAPSRSPGRHSPPRP